MTFPQHTPVTFEAPIMVQAFPLNEHGYMAAIAWLNAQGKDVDIDPNIAMETDGFTIINMTNGLRELRETRQERIH